MNVKERLNALKNKMLERSVSAVIVPSADHHQSEYVGEHFKEREFITGFTGSAGTAVITREKALLWTDGRYFIQAAAQLEGTGFELMKQGAEGVPTIYEYILENLSEGDVLAFDGRVVSAKEGRLFSEIAKKRGAFIDYSLDLVGEIWENRPPLSQKPAFFLDIKYAGETAQSKLTRIRAAMKEKGASFHILTSLDDICWTLNIRGGDVDFCPLVLAYAVIDENFVYLYTDENKFSDEMKQALESLGARFLPYNDIYEDVKKLTSPLLLDPARLNFALYNNIKAPKIEAENPEILFKAVKNDIEISNIRTACLKDSAAHIRFMKWLKENVGKIKITEISAAQKLDEFRKEMGNFLRPSFEPLSAFGDHAAIVHYVTTEETDREVTLGGMFLTDTGAGYLEGSTDITRTFAFGEIPKIMRRDFTLVAAGNLALMNTKFLKGSTGLSVDLAARAPLWAHGLDYNHGTGHGVGYLMNIHEPPISINYKNKQQANYPLLSGMIVTDEPGVYVENSHGIRLENDLLVREDEKTEFGQFMRFECLTFIPFDLDAVDESYLSEPQKKMLNDYHAAVYEKVSPLLSEDEKEWLLKYTRKI